MSATLSQRLHFVKGIDPIADAFDTTQFTGPINARNYSKVMFIVHKGVGATGTATLTVLAGSDAIAAGTTGPTTSTAIPFRYKRPGGTDDLEGAFTTADSAGFTTAAHSSTIHIIEVDCAQLGGLPTDQHFLYLKSVEVFNSPCVGSVLIVGVGGRFQQDTPLTAVA